MVVIIFRAQPVYEKKKLKLSLFSIKFNKTELFNPNRMNT
jgi:hypothetical protein